MSTCPHSDRDHAVLSASGAHRWMNCTPSALLEAELPDTSSPYAEEGTRAHEVAEYTLLTKIGVDSITPPKHLLDDDEMLERAEAYADYVIGLCDSPSGWIFAETQLDFGRWVPGGWGTSDAVVVTDTTLHIIDYKYGRSPVSPVRNPQLMCYALGGLDLFSMVDDFEMVALHIVQPRTQTEPERWDIPVSHLLAWGEFVLAPAAEQAARGEGDRHAGDWCHFCKLAPTCRTKNENNLVVARREFDQPADLTDEEISEVLTLAPGLKSWLNNLESYATRRAEKDGHQYPGLKLVEGRSYRKIVDPEAAVQAAREAGYTEDEIFETKLLGITALEKSLGKQDFKEVFGPYVAKPPGKVTIAPESDPRPAYSPQAEAQEHFK